MAGTPGTFRFPEVNAKPSAPPAGYALLYIKTDNVLYLQDSSAVEIALGSASSITALTGEATATGPGSAVITLDNSAVIGKVLTGFTAGPNSTILATDTILEAFEKTQAQIDAITTVTNAATSTNTPNTIVKRNASGNFSAGTITANLTGAASDNVLKSGDTMTGELFITAAGTGLDVTNNIVAGGTITGSNLSGTNTGDVTVSDTNSIDLTITGQLLSADLKLSADSASAGNIKSTTTIHTDGLHIENPYGTPVQIGTTNFIGAASSFALSDHVHAHGNQTNGSLHAAATTSVNGFMSASDKTKLDNATSSNTASTIVSRDGSGDFSAGTITANLIGNVTGSASNNVLKAGDTMTGALTMSGNLIHSVATPVIGTDAANKDYVDNLAVGIIPQTPILDPDLIDDSLSSPPGSPAINRTYLIGPAPTGAWSTIGAGRLVYWDGSDWHDGLGRAVIVGDRLGINFELAGTLGGNYIGKQGQIATVTNATPGSYAYTYEVPLYRWTALVDNHYSYSSGDTYYYNGTTWIEIATGITLEPGNAIAISGNIIDVKYDNTTISINGSNQLTVLNAPSFTGSLSGDVTGTQSATVIANNAVTNVKLAQMPANTLKGNNTVSTTNAADLTVAQVNTMLGTVTSVSASSPLQSSGGATPTISFTNQTANTILAGPSSGGAAAPTFRTLARADIPLFATTTKTANYTLTIADDIVFCDTSGGAFTITLPSPTGIAGKIFRIIDSTGNFQTNNLTLARSASEKIEGLAASKVLQTNWGWFTIVTNGTDWWVG